MGWAGHIKTSSCAGAWTVCESFAAADGGYEDVCDTRQVSCLSSRASVALASRSEVIIAASVASQQPLFHPVARLVFSTYRRRSTRANTTRASLVQAPPLRRSKNPGFLVLPAVPCPPTDRDASARCTLLFSQPRRYHSQGVWSGRLCRALTIPQSHNCAHRSGVL